jgi:hypothetical protein
MRVFATAWCFPIPTDAGGGAFVWLFPACGTNNARGTWFCVLILKRFFQTIVTSTTTFTIKLSFVAGLA